MEKKTIRMLFTRNGAYFSITISDGKVLYWDKLQGSLWGGSLQYLPPSPSAIRTIDNSRNKIPQDFKKLLEVSSEELAEYEAVKHDDNKIKELVLKDTQKFGCQLVKEF